MNIARLKDISIGSTISNRKTCVCEAIHLGEIVGSAVVMMDHNSKRAASLIHFQTDPEYRHIGIGKNMLDVVVGWSRARARLLHGYIAENKLVGDTLPHITHYLGEYGFQIDGIFFSMNL
ncbi:MAG: GNAT family N-acetyltransferase [Microgenomates group bacterium]